MMVLATIALLFVTTAQAPAAGLSTTIGSVKGGHDVAKDWLTKAADQVSEENYAFKPTPDVRSMGELFAHVADANFMICGMVSGAKPSMTAVEKTRKTKADIIAALAESFKFCDAAYAGLTEANANETLPKFFVPGTHTRLGVMAFNNAHQFEHYGNIVTYMRMKKMVPPSSAGGM
jgi:uncharacterized damage-inducible protein DinB